MTSARVAASVLLVATTLMVASPVSAAQWYESDAFGVVHDAIDEENADDYPYVVRVERSAGLEVQTLFHESEPIERIELVYADNHLKTRRWYRDDELQATEHFSYWADGSLRLVRRIATRGETVEYRYRDGRLDEEWVVGPTATERTTYDEVGRIVERTRFDGDELVERETREYWGDEPSDPLRRVVLLADGTETITRYDEAGRLLGSSVAREGEVATDRVRVYEDGLLVEEREQRDGVTMLWRYEYEREELLTERYFEGGELVKRTDYRVDGFTRKETLYRDGAEALRVYFRDRDRVREEVIRDGEVIRTRTFETPGGGAT